MSVEKTVDIKYPREEYSNIYYNSTDGWNYITPRYIDLSDTTKIKVVYSSDVTTLTFPSNQIRVNSVINDQNSYTVLALNSARKVIQPTICDNITMILGYIVLWSVIVCMSGVVINELYNIIKYFYRDLPKKLKEIEARLPKRKT